MTMTVEKEDITVPVPMVIRDRIIGFERLPVEQLEPHPHNWRIHPEQQRQAMQGILGEIGYAGALIVRPLPAQGKKKRYQIIDGHLRADLSAGGAVPCLVVDLTEQEAMRLLAMLDKVTGMAEPDNEMLRVLFEGIDAPDDVLLNMVWPAEEMAALEGSGGGSAPGEFQEYDEDIETEHQCPKCGYEWSGKKK